MWGFDVQSQVTDARWEAPRTARRSAASLPGEPEWPATQRCVSVRLCQCTRLAEQHARCDAPSAVEPTVLAAVRPARGRDPHSSRAGLQTCAPCERDGHVGRLVAITNRTR
jgi:hypothetical protein